MFRYLCVTACLVLAVAAADSASLPKEFKTCKRGDDACLQEAIIGAVPYLVKGLPELDVPPIDPLAITGVEINRGSGPVSIRLSLRNQKIAGIRNVKIIKLQSDLKEDSYSLSADIHIPSLVSIGDYKINGNILVLPISGEGKNNLTLSDAHAHLDIKGHVQAGYVHMDSFLFTFELGGLHVELENLFNGVKVLGDNMNKVINDNWKVLLEELKPAIEDAFGEKFKDIAGRIYSRVLYATVHPTS